MDPSPDLLIDAFPPIVIIEGDDLSTYPTVRLVCSHLEAEDVNDGLYEVFDGRGRRIQLLTSGGLVFAEWMADAAPDPAGLERQVRHHIESVGADRIGIVNIDDASLEVMLDALVRFSSSRMRRPRK